MLYCEHCQIAFDGDTCPECGSLGRTPRGDDYCLLTQQPGIFAKMLLDVLEQNGIEAAERATQGATGIFSNMNMEIYRIYVPIEQFARAAELRDELFSPDSVAEDGDGEGFESEEEEEEEDEAREDS